MGRWLDVFDEGREDVIPLYDVKELDEVKQRGEGGFGEVLEVKVRLRHGVAAGGAAGGAGGGAQQERLPLGAATPAAQGMNGPSGDHQNSGGAADHGMLCSVAWKRVKGGANVDEQQEMLVEEARSLLVFESDRLVKCLGLVYDYGQSPPRFAGFLMELMDGTLHQYLEDFAVSHSEAAGQRACAVVGLLCDLLEGLSVLHGLGLVHRDLHAGNVLYQGSRFKLSDLGTSTWGRNASLGWLGGLTVEVGRFDTLPQDACLPGGSSSSASASGPYSLQGYDMFSVGILAARLVLWAAGRDDKEWDKYGHRTWKATNGAEASDEQIRAFVCELPGRAKACASTSGLSRLVGMIEKWSHPIAAQRPSPSEALGDVQALYQDMCSPSDDDMAGRRQLLGHLVELGGCEGKTRWRHARAVGMRCTPRNLLYEMRAYMKREERQALNEVEEEPLEQKLAAKQLTGVEGSRWIDRLCGMKEVARARRVLGAMCAAGLRPSEAAFKAVLEGYRKRRGLRAVEEMRKILGLMDSHGGGRTEEPWRVLLNALCDLGKMAEAEQELGEMERMGLPTNIRTYTALMEGYREAGRPEAAEDVLRRIEAKELRPTVVTFTVLVEAYAHTGRMAEAQQVVQRMKAAGVQPNDYTFGALIGGFADLGDKEAIPRVRADMLEANVSLNHALYDELISACRDEDAVQALLGQMRGQGLTPHHWTQYSRMKVLLRMGRRLEDIDVYALFDELRPEDAPRERPAPTFRGRGPRGRGARGRGGRGRGRGGGRAPVGFAW